jgi:hypothetical protein
MLAVILYIVIFIVVVRTIKDFFLLTYDHITQGPPITYFRAGSVIECPSIVYCVSQTVPPLRVYLLITLTTDLTLPRDVVFHFIMTKKRNGLYDGNEKDAWQLTMILYERR